jgi:hypothetical protein
MDRRTEHPSNTAIEPLQQLLCHSAALLWPLLQVWTASCAYVHVDLSFILLHGFSSALQLHMPHWVQRAALSREGQHLQHYQPLHKQGRLHGELKEQE